MPLNKLENFIKNTEGRILYVNPSDLDSTDAIENQGNSLTTPFKTIQRALVEAARFSYLKGNNNDTVEKTTILLYPGEHIVDNRPGYAIKASGTSAKTVNFSSPFFTGTNTLNTSTTAFLPTVGITLEGAVSGDYFKITSVTGTQFVIEVRDSSNNFKDLNFKYTAIGFGKGG